jgi:glycosyltransferase involved in cell wall biosynthesis
MASAPAARSDSKRVLILTTAYGPGRQHAPLMETLADRLVRDGHQVDVAGLKWDAAADSGVSRYRQENGVEVVMAAPAGAGSLGQVASLLVKWVFSSNRALAAAKRAFGDRRYDVTVVVTPLVTLWSLVNWARGRSRRTYAFVTDFFPIQHASTGMFPKGGFQQLAHWAETRMLRSVDVIGTMSPRGVQFLRDRYRLRADQPIETLFLWGDGAAYAPPSRAATRQRFGLPEAARIVVFTGQLTVGRGIEDVLAAAQLASTKKADLLFVFVGSGTLAAVVAQAAEAPASNVRLYPPLANEDYLDFISCCDIGLVATVSSLDAPTFPSKTIDYLKARLPIAASVEATSDYHAFVNQHGFGIAVIAGQPSSLLNAINRIDGEAAVKMRDNGQQVLRDFFSVDRAADQILGQRSRQEQA